MSISASMVGRLTADPQQSQVNNSNVVNFNVAVDSTRKQGDGYLTTFVRVSVWGRRGDFVMQHFHKGDPISISGEIYEVNYQTKQGEERQQLTLNADRAEFVPRPSQNRNNQSMPQGQPNQPMPQGQPNPQANYNNYQAPQANYQGSPNQYQQAPQNGQFNQQANDYTQMDPNDLPFA